MVFKILLYAFQVELVKEWVVNNITIFFSCKYVLCGSHYNPPTFLRAISLTEGTIFLKFCAGYDGVCIGHTLSVSTTPVRKWGFDYVYFSCLLFRWTTLRGKHCQHPIAAMGVVETFEHTPHKSWCHIGIGIEYSISQ